MKYLFRKDEYAICRSQKEWIIDDNFYNEVMKQLKNQATAEGIEEINALNITFKDVLDVMMLSSELRDEVDYGRYHRNDMPIEGYIEQDILRIAEALCEKTEPNDDTGWEFWDEYQDDDNWRNCEKIEE